MAENSMGETCLPEELRSLFLFEALTETQLATLCANGHIATFEPGIVCNEGDPQPASTSFWTASW